MGPEEHEYHQDQQAGEERRLLLNWAQPSNAFKLSSVAALGRKNKVLATLTGKGEPKKIKKVKRSKGKTFGQLSFRKPKGTRKLRFTVKVSALVLSERTISQMTLRP